MEQSPLISEMQKFQFGTKIFCADGEYGVLTHMCFDATTNRMTHLGVKPGRLFSGTVYVPYTTVVDASSNGVNLTITRDQLMQADKQDLADALLDAKSIVQSSATVKGLLLLVAVHPESGVLAYCVVHHLRPGQDTLLQAPYVTKLEAGHITVSLPEAILQTLPPYRSDAELRREVEEILFDLTPLHVDFKGMSVHVLDGVLYLDGNISSALRGDIVVDQALGVPGLLEIKNRLVADDNLASYLAMVLARDSRTSDLPIGVYPRLGAVRLSGAVHTVEQKEAASAIVHSFPGVRSVINSLVVDPKADMLYAMSSAEGGETEDKVPGKYIRHTK